MNTQSPPDDTQDLTDHCTPPGTQWKGILRLVVWLIPLAVVWLVVLPWTAAQPQMANHLEWLDDQGVDPSAMYYTELEVMKPILQGQTQRVRRGEYNFWNTNIR